MRRLQVGSCSSDIHRKKSEQIIDWLWIILVSLYVLLRIVLMFVHMLHVHVYQFPTVVILYPIAFIQVSQIILLRQFNIRQCLYTPLPGRSCSRLRRAHRSEHFNKSEAGDGLQVRHHSAAWILSRLPKVCSQGCSCQVVWHWSRRVFLPRRDEIGAEVL